MFVCITEEVPIDLAQCTHGLQAEAVDDLLYCMFFVFSRHVLSKTN